MVEQGVLAWLLEADPSLRWQVQRDLAGAPEGVWRATRARVATEGFGARLLAHQDPDGQWAGGAYFPADTADTAEDEPGQPWTATTWALKDLREWGVDASALLPGTADLLARNSRWEYDDLPYWDGEVDVCINAYTLATGAWLGADVSSVERFFVERQLDDGGWNCAWVDGATRSSVHSTLNAVVALLDHEVRTGGTPELRAARHRGEEHLLVRHLLRRLSTVERVRSARDDDGTWRATTQLEGRTWFAVDGGVGEPSRWLTFRALRLLRWWDEDEDVGRVAGRR